MRILTLNSGVISFDGRPSRGVLDTVCSRVKQAIYRWITVSVRPGCPASHRVSLAGQPKPPEGRGVHPVGRIGPTNYVLVQAATAQAGHGIPSGSMRGRTYQKPYLLNVASAGLPLGGDDD